MARGRVALADCVDRWRDDRAGDVFQKVRLLKVQKAIALLPTRHDVNHP